MASEARAMAERRCRDDKGAEPSAAVGRAIYRHGRGTQGRDDWICDPIGVTIATRLPSDCCRLGFSSFGMQNVAHMRPQTRLGTIVRVNERLVTVVVNNRLQTTFKTML
jgi:hypothetical protein